ENPILKHTRQLLNSGIENCRICGTNKAWSLFDYSSYGVIQQIYEFPVLGFLLVSQPLLMLPSSRQEMADEQPNYCSRYSDNCCVHSAGILHRKLMPPPVISPPGQVDSIPQMKTGRIVSPARLWIVHLFETG